MLIVKLITKAKSFQQKSRPAYTAEGRLSLENNDRYSKCVIEKYNFILFTLWKEKVTYTM